MGTPGVIHSFRIFFRRVAASFNKQLEKEIEFRKEAEAKKEMLILDLQKALKEIKTLSGMLPICASCKKIRDDKGYWNQLESYIGKHSDVQFSHGMCPDCAKKLYEDLYQEFDSGRGASYTEDDES